MKIKALAVQDTAFLHLRNVDSKLLHESTPQGDQPVGITLYSPGTKIYANALAAKQARLDGLLKARDSGVLMVRHGETSTQFRSLSEILQAIVTLQGEIDDLAGTTSTRRVRYTFQSGKGL